MILYEATDGTIGEAYVRCYVWAEDYTRALELAKTAFNKDRQVGANILLIRLMSDNSPAFASEVSDAGFVTTVQL